MDWCQMCADMCLFGYVCANYVPVCASYVPVCVSYVPARCHCCARFAWRSVLFGTDAEAMLAALQTRRVRRQETQANGCEKGGRSEYQIAEEGACHHKDQVQAVEERASKVLRRTTRNA